MKINHKLAVHAYKFDGCLYRTFEFPRIIYEDQECLILDLQKTRIISQAKNKKFYHSVSKKNSLWVMFKEEWYNLFVTINDKNKLIYYFNVASPFIYEEDALKYVDLDLDVRVVGVNTNLETVKILDEKEFLEHSVQMLYPKKLVNKAKLVQEEIISKLKNRFFQKRFNTDLFEEFAEILKRNEK